MAWKMQAQCDVCGKYKEQVNHWWIVFSSWTVHFWRLDTHLQESGHVIIPWSDDLADLKFGQHCCSQKCAMDLVQRWMDEQQKGAACAE